MLSAPGVCPSCGPLKLFLVNQRMTQERAYERDVWAPDAATAVKLVDEYPPEWPADYDTRTLSSVDGPYTTEEITDESADERRLGSILKHARIEVGFRDEEYEAAVAEGAAMLADHEPDAFDDLGDLESSALVERERLAARIVSLATEWRRTTEGPIDDDVFLRTLGSAVDAYLDEKIS